MIHRLKIERKYADAVCGMAKTFEVRKNDRNFQIGDIITFEVVDSNEYHGIEGRAYFVPYVLTSEDFPEGIKDGYCVLTLARLDDELAYYYAHDLKSGENEGGFDGNNR